jgi:hypothetical protein
MQRNSETEADRQTSTIATSPHRPTPHHTTWRTHSTHLISSDNRSRGDRKAKVVQEAVRIVVEVSCHVVGSEGRRYDTPHYHILLEGFREVMRGEGRSDGGIEFELKLVRNQIQGLSRIFYLSIYLLVFFPSFHPSFLLFSLSHFFLNASIPPLFLPLFLPFCLSFFLCQMFIIDCCIQAVSSPLSNPQMREHCILSTSIERNETGLD